MADSAVGSESRKSNFQISPERMAWSILLGSFAIFCLSCALITFGVHFFFFRSNVSLQTTLQVARGIPAGVGGVDRAVGGIYPLSSGSSIRTDTTDRFSQSSVYFRDERSDNALIAVITMKSDSALTVRNATRPRFDWGSSNYVIDVSNVTGQFDVFIASDLGRGIEFNIWTPNQALIKLSASGHYSFTASDTVRLTNWNGEALLVSPGLISNRSIPRGEQAILAGGGAEITLAPARINLLQNNYLRASEASASSLEAGDPNPPDRWSCANGPNNMPRGRYGFETSPDGRRALRFVRGDETTTTPGSTFCTQTIGETSAGVDVSAFDQLEFRASVYIASQSLSGCGFEGSECPLMMQINYIREDGQVGVWYHGVYARRPGPNENYPLNCASCLREHILIYEDAWYTYESGNLFDIYQLPGTRPRQITGVTFYASGHHYDVFVSEVDLLVSDVDNGQNGVEAESEG